MRGIVRGLDYRGPAGGGGGLTAVNISAGTTSNNLSAVTFSNSNNVTFGLNASTITASASFAQSVQTQGITGDQLSIGVSTGGNTQGNTTVQTGQRFVMVGSNMITISQATGAGSTTLTFNATQSNQQVTMFATSNTTQSSTGTANASSLIFAGAGIASVGITGGSVVISVPAGGGGGDGGVFAGVSTFGNTAGSTGTVSTGNFVFVGSNNITLSQTTGAAGSAATMTILGPTLLSGGVSTGGNTAGSTGMVSNQLVFVGSNGITLNQSTGGASSGTITISGDGATLYSYEPWPANMTNATQVLSFNSGTSGSAQFYPFVLNNYVSAEMLNLAFSVTFLTVGTSSGQQTQTISYALYTQGTGTNSTTMSAITSASFSIGVTGNNSSYTINQPTSSNTAGYTTGATNSAGAQITSGYSGQKIVGFPVNSLMTPGQYWLGIFGRGSTSSINLGISYSLVVGGLPSSINAAAPIGSFSTNYSTGTNILLRLGNWRMGHARFTSAGQTDLPGSVAFSALTNDRTEMPHMLFWANRT